MMMAPPEQHQEQDMMSYGELRVLAEAATPGPWSNGTNNATELPSIIRDYGTVIAEMTTGTSDPPQVTANAAYIAAAHPARVIELLNAVAIAGSDETVAWATADELHQERDRISKILDKWRAEAKKYDYATAESSVYRKFTNELDVAMAQTRYVDDRQ